MLWRVVHRELLGHLVSLRFAVTFLLVLLLVGSAFYLGARQTLRRREEYSVRVVRYAEELQERRSRWPRTAWGMEERRILETEGVSHAVPPAGLDAVARGLSGIWPLGITVTAVDWTNAYEDMGENPLAHLYQEPDFTYVVGVVLSLLAMVLVFDAVCGEKESGTLRATLAHSVPRHTVLLGKWVAACLAIGFPFLIATGVGVAYAYAVGAIGASRAETGRLAWIMTAALLYIGAFVSFGLLVSTLAHRAVTALWIGLFAWGLWILVLPTLTPVLAQIIAPAPTTREITAEKEAVVDEIRLMEGRLRLSPLAEGFERAREQLAQEQRRRRAEWDRFRLRMTGRQNAWAEGLARVSPLGSWVYAATNLAQTGSRAYMTLEESRRRLLAGMAQIKQERDNWDWWNGEPPALTAESLPGLHYHVAGLGESLDAALPDLLLLAIWNVLFVMAAFMRFLRYDVR